MVVNGANNVKLVLASHNAKKLAELSHLISGALGHDISGQIVTAKDLGISDVIEDGSTFLENALLKAQHVYNETGLPALADDSGLIVDFMGNAPGIISARWAGTHGDDLANNQLLLQQMIDLKGDTRSAHFVCTVALVSGENSDQKVTQSGEMHGQIITEMRGSNGFGYDVIFVPDDYVGTEFAGLTSAQLTSDQKNAISHRGRAIGAILPDLLKLF